MNGYVLLPFGNATDEGAKNSPSISGAQTSINFDEPLKLMNGQSYTLQLVISKADANSNGFYVGFGNVAFKAAPEPTTTALSLLALAGLALRRRRK